MTRDPLAALTPSQRRALAARQTDPRARAVASVAPVARRRAGAVAHARGDAFEALLSRHHAVALAEGLADVRKVGAPVAVGRGGKPVAWAGVGPADYVGTLRGGRSVVVEAKSVDGRFSRAHVAEHQREHLDACAALGGLALLALEVRGCGVYVVEWATAPWRVSSHAVTATENGREVRRVVESRTLGAEELAGHRAAEGCYLRRWAAARGEVQR